MDETERYILMSKKATKLQVWWNAKKNTNYQCYANRKSGDIVFMPAQSELIESDIDYHKHYEATIATYSLFKPGLQYIWLPTQSQLQDIYAEHIAKLMGLIKTSNDVKIAFVNFGAWLTKQYMESPYTNVPTNNFDSGEQLWLAFVMQEIYNLKWNNEDNKWQKADK